MNLAVVALKYGEGRRLGKVGNPRCISVVIFSCYSFIDVDPLEGNEIRQ